MVYRYREGIEKELVRFEHSLRAARYAPPTIRQYRNYAGIYLAWLEVQGIAAGEVTYPVFTDFIFQLKAERSLNQCRRIILAVRHYYKSLGIDKNPAAGIHIRGRRRSILHEMVTYGELIGLYHSFRVLDDRTARNKVMLGILIFQAVTTGELQRLEVSHLRLAEGKVYIPGQGRQNSRILPLEAAQLLDLQEYVRVIRPRMLAHLNARRPGRKPAGIHPAIHERLFFSENGREQIKDSLLHLFRAIKRRYPQITSARVIRTTVLAEWLKSKDIRIVQYMAGHRWVSSTERYNAFNLEELKDSLNRHHPLERNDDT
jgi:integrase/recombinase XerD